MGWGGSVSSAVNKVKNSSTGRAVSSGNYAGAAQEYAKDVGSGGLRKDIRRATGKDTSKQDKAAKKAAQSRANEAAATKKQVAGMKKVDDRLLSAEQKNAAKYKSGRDASVRDYLDRVTNLETELITQQKDAQHAYSNDIQPRMKNLMEDAGVQAGQAMSLAEAGNVNNSVHQGVRNLYDQQAQAVGRRSLHDVGVLNALGAQATAGQMGSGVPMTGSQLQLLSAQNQQAGGMAYARAQQQMQSLREQGLNRGFDESAAQYERGERARNRYAGSVGDYEQAMDRNINREAGFRAEKQGYASDRFGTNLGVSRENKGLAGGLNQLEHGLKTGQKQRNIAGIAQQFGNEQELLNARIAAANAENASKAAMMGQGIGVLGAGVGAMAGGAPGAMAGYQVGSGVGGAMMGQGAQTPVAGNYRPNPYQQYPGYGQGGYARYTA